MQDLPHHYSVRVQGESESSLAASAENLPTLNLAPPAQFGGPGDQWSPEDLLMASVASCFVLSFRAIARASRLEWLSIDCDSRGELDRVDRLTQFTSVHTTVSLVIPAGEDESKARKLLEKAEAACLITNSMSATVSLEVDIVVGG